MVGRDAGSHVMLKVLLRLLPRLLPRRPAPVTKHVSINMISMAMILSRLKIGRWTRRTLFQDVGQRNIVQILVGRFVMCHYCHRRSVDEESQVCGGFWEVENVGRVFLENSKGYRACNTVVL